MTQAGSIMQLLHSDARLAHTVELAAAQMLFNKEHSSVKSHVRVLRSLEGGHTEMAGPETILDTLTAVTYNTYDHKVDRSLGIVLSKKILHRKKKEHQRKLLAATLSRVSNQKVIPTSTVRQSIEMSYLGCHSFLWNS